MTTDENWCPKHRGKVNELSRRNLKAKIEEIPKYEGSNWYRHKCPFCAYEMGFSEGKKAAAQKISQPITS